MMKRSVQHSCTWPCQDSRTFAIEVAGVVCKADVLCDDDS